MFTDFKLDNFFASSNLANTLRFNYGQLKT